MQNALVGVTSSIAVESRDRFNNRVRHGESPLQVRVVPESRARPAGPAESKPKEAIVEIHDDDSGIFLIDIIPQVGGPIQDIRSIRRIAMPLLPTCGASIITEAR